MLLNNSENNKKISVYFLFEILRCGKLIQIQHINSNFHYVIYYVSFIYLFVYMHRHHIVMVLQVLIEFMRSVFRHLQNEMIPKSQNNFNNLKHAFINCGFVLCALYYYTDRGSLLNIMMMSKNISCLSNVTLSKN